MLKKNILFIQGAGSGAHNADQKLVDSIQTSLSDGCQIHYPQMPNEEAPDYEPWKNCIAKNISEIYGPMIIIGHSLGGSLLLKYLSESKIEQQIAGVFVLAAPFWGGDDNWQHEGFTLLPKFSSKLPDAPIYLYHCTDDTIVSVSHIDMYKDQIPSAHSKTYAVGGHQFNDGLSTVAFDIKNLKGF